MLCLNVTIRRVVGVCYCFEAKISVVFKNLITLISLLGILSYVAKYRVHLYKFTLNLAT